MKWISVKDRLPDRSGLYLVHGQGGYMVVVQYSTFFGKFNAWDGSASRDVEQLAFDDVTHWMPLPAPPAVDEDAAPEPEPADIDEAEADTESEEALLAFPLCRDVEWQTGWRRVRCPHCGNACWLRPQARDLLKEQPELVWACAACAEKGKAEERIDCVLCGAERSVAVTRSTENGHMRGVCERCGARYME